MVAYVPIPPKRASDLVESAKIGPPVDVLANFAAAGLVRAYARMMETVHPDGRREEVRDKRIARDTWRRILAEGRIDDIPVGVIRLGGSPEFGGGPKITLTGIRFDDASLQALALQHGEPATPSGGSNGVTLRAAAAEPAPSKPNPPAPVPAGASIDPVNASVDEVAVEVAPCFASGLPLFSPPAAAPVQAPPASSRSMAGIPEGAKSLTIDQAATALSIGRTKLYDMAQRGDVKITKLGKRSVISMDQIDAMLRDGCS